MVLNTIECKPTDKRVEGTDGLLMDCKMYLIEDGVEKVIDVNEVFSIGAKGTSFSVMMGTVGDEEVIWIKPDDQVSSFAEVLDRRKMKATFPSQGLDILIGLRKETTE